MRAPMAQADWLGMDPDDADLHWIARKGLKTPLPKPWRPCEACVRDATSPLSPPAPRGLMQGRGGGGVLVGTNAAAIHD